MYILAAEKFDYVMHLQVEIKNLNSFSSINRAIDFEIARQALLYSQGKADQIVQETRLWEEGSQVIIIASYFTIMIPLNNKVHFCTS